MIGGAATGHAISYLNSLSTAQSAKLVNLILASASDEQRFAILMKIADVANILISIHNRQIRKVRRLRRNRQAQAG